MDAKNGVFCVEKSFSGPSTPIHVIKNTWGPIQKIVCEVEMCNLNAEFASRSGLLPFECHHLQSLSFCPRASGAHAMLASKELDTMVESNWFGVERKKELLKRQEKAKEDGVPMSVLLTIGGPPTKEYISIYEPTVAYYSRLGRVVVAYDRKNNTWHCPCAGPRKSCVHKAIAKWHLFETKNYLFKRVKSTEEEGPQEMDHTNSYPPNACAERMVKYIKAHKKLPSVLPKTVFEESRDAKALQGFPKYLIPTEVTCTECEQQSLLSDPQLITSKAKIVTYTGIVEGKISHILFS